MRPCLPTALVLAAVATGCTRAPVTAAQVADLPTPATVASPTDDALVARGEYLVRISGCNDCHTPGYEERGGDVGKAQWLTGTALGYRGPWGTTYAANLRLLVDGMDEAQWLDYSGKLRTRPIMPDINVRAMTRDDRLALYRFIRSLGPAGRPAPAYLPPGRKPPLPYFELALPQVPAGTPPARG